MKLNRETLCALIPHADSMCLLSSVVSWDDKQIVCTARSHCSSDNPLRSQGRLAAIHALEYAAQAMAVHGGLLAQQQGKRMGDGYLVAVRNASFYVDRLDLLEQPLILKASRLLATDTSQIYQIEVSAAEQVVAEARLTTMNSMATDR